MPAEPTFSELPDATDYDQTPVPMATEPSVAIVLDLADAGGSRREAESFAVSFAQLQSDSRIERDQAAFLARTLSAQAEAELREYLLSDYTLQSGLGTDRHYDPSDEVWLRSKATENNDEPTAVMVEVAAMLVSEPLQGRFFNRTRIDLIREDESWRVLAYAWAVSGDNLAADEPAQLENQLEGPGWRRLS